MSETEKPTETPSAGIVKEPATNICGECRYLADCAAKNPAMAYRAQACETFKRKRGRPATAVKTAAGIIAAAPGAPEPPIAPGPITESVEAAPVMMPGRVLTPEELARVPSKDSALIWTTNFKKRANVIEKLLMLGEIPNLVGPAGTGKDKLAYEVAARNNWPLVRINCDGGMRSYTLFGRLAPDKDNPGSLRWQDGLVTECVRKGWLLILDEANFLDAETTSALHGLMEPGERKMSIADNSEIIQAHPDFKMLLTQNPTGYLGVKPLNEAFKDRCQFMQIEYDSAIDAKLLDKLDITENVRTGLSNLIKAIRQMAAKGEMRQPFGHRTLSNVVKLSRHFPLMDALEMAYLNKLGQTDMAACKTAFADLACIVKANDKAEKDEKKVA